VKSCRAQRSLGATSPSPVCAGSDLHLKLPSLRRKGRGGLTCGSLGDEGILSTDLERFESLLGPRRIVGMRDPMKRAAFGVSLALLLLLAASPSQARGHGGFGGHGGFHGSFHAHGFGHGFGFHGFGFHGPRVVIGVGPAFWWGSTYPGWYYPPPYYRYADPSIAAPPPADIEQAPPPPPSYWYYCQSAGAYYPNVKACPERWVQIPTTPPE